MIRIEGSGESPHRQAIRLSDPEVRRRVQVFLLNL
jgi:hypothetical protein